MSEQLEGPVVKLSSRFYIFCF